MDYIIWHLPHELHYIINQYQRQTKWIRFRYRNTQGIFRLVNLPIMKGRDPKSSVLRKMIVIK